MMALSATPKKTSARDAHLRRDAENLAIFFPALLAQAERVAAIIAQGVHGRRRPGTGETFWQYRPYQNSDPAHHIDWRRSARGDKIYIRENEWEAANTVYFWRDGSEGMNWTSSQDHHTKQDRASLLCMALASLLMRAGERCAVMGESEHPKSGRSGLEHIAYSLATSKGQTKNLTAPIPAHARLVIATDFLDGTEAWQKTLSTLSARPAKGALLHIFDPAERDFPYQGRMEMRLPGPGPLKPLLIGRAERVCEDYKQAFQTHMEALAHIARRLDWPLIVHSTDTPPALALTALYTAISGEAL